MLTLSPCGCSVPVVQRGGLTVAQSFSLPHRYADAVPHPFALAEKPARLRCGFRDACVPVAGRCHFALRRDELTETWITATERGEPA